MNVELLKTVLALPTYTRAESQVVAFLVQYGTERGYKVRVDQQNNVYYTKGKLHQKGEKYPLVVAHTDSVHNLQRMAIRETDGVLRAYSVGGDQIGLGGDCKAGIFICLELMEAFPKIKAFFPMGEEQGCIGSRWAAENRKRFFRNVGYAIEFDSPCGHTMSYSNGGIRNFDDNGVFINKALPALDRYGITSWQRHPYTDVMALRKAFDFPCLNVAAGYFRMHSQQEYVVCSDVQNSIMLGYELIASLRRVGYVDIEHGKRDTYGPNPSAKRPLCGCHFPDSPAIAPIHAAERLARA